MHVFTKNHTFLIDICEKKIHGSLILLKNTKIILFGKYPCSDGILYKKGFESKSKENFCKNTSKKRCSSLLLVFLQIFPMIHLQYCFYLIC